MGCSRFGAFGVYRDISICTHIHIHMCRNGGNQRASIMVRYSIILKSLESFGFGIVGKF